MKLRPNVRKYEFGERGDAPSIQRTLKDDQQRRTYPPLSFHIFGPTRVGAGCAYGICTRT